MIASLPSSWPDVLLAALVATLIYLIVFCPWPHEQRPDDEVGAGPVLHEAGLPSLPGRAPSALTAAGAGIYDHETDGWGDAA